MKITTKEEKNYSSRDARDEDSAGHGDKSGGDRKKKSMGRFSRSRPPLDLIFDYKDTFTLKKFITEHGKIIPRRVSRLNAFQQRELTREVKRARQLALIPYTERD